MILDCVIGLSPLIISEQDFLTPKTVRVTSVLSLESIYKTGSQDPKCSPGQEISGTRAGEFELRAGSRSDICRHTNSPHPASMPAESGQRAGRSGSGLSHPCDLGFGWGKRGSRASEFLDASRIGNLRRKEKTSSNPN